MYQEPASDHYTEPDKKRTLPIRQQVKLVMLDKGWFDLDQVARQLGARAGTVASKLRELCDRDHAQEGLAYERKRAGDSGVHLYRLYTRQPEQLPLLEA